MALENNIELVIKIDERTYEDIKNGKVYSSMRDVPQESILAIANGTPLQKPGRKFEEIVVEYPTDDCCPYPKYRGKPYFAIKYEENGEHYIGFDTYEPEVLSKYLHEYFVIPTKEYKETPKRLTNKEWVDLLCEQFDISRTSAKDMLHAMMSVKKEDNFKKQFNKPAKTDEQNEEDIELE